MAKESEKKNETTSHWSAGLSAKIGYNMPIHVYYIYNLPSLTTKGWFNLAGKQNCGRCKYHPPDNCSQQSQRSYGYYLKVTDKEKTIGVLRGKGETTILAKGMGAEAMQKIYANSMIVCIIAYIAVAY